MALITATLTNAARALLPQAMGGLAVLPAIDSFSVGEGGWILTPSGVIPRTPDGSLTNLDCIVNPTRYPLDGNGNFNKLLNPGDLVFVAPGTLEVTCLLDFADFNNDGYGNNPEIYEIGLFAGGTMMAYGTFQQQLKTPGNQLPNIVRITFGI